MTEFTVANAGGKVTYRDDDLVTITPVIKSFTNVKRDVNSKRLPVNGTMNGLNGIYAGNRNDQPNPGPGIKFTAEAISGGLELGYVQVLESIVNGFNSGGDATYTLDDGTKIALVVDGTLKDQAGNKLDFPLLDANINSQSPMYPNNEYNGIAGANGGHDSVRLTMLDSPGIGRSRPALNEEVEKIDTRWFFVSSLVVRFDDYSLYTVATFRWDVNFYATTRVLGLGVTVIPPQSKVSSDVRYTKSNVNPAVTTPPVVNASGTLIGKMI